ncbi:hypothetical protein [Rheinheimera nanhaiensis]|uniref:hypothetical protein n=1 Tax=Rheinheimera nanhaiensis TaxID=1163621 RepID=UPI00058FF314|nr:hypothetical protein [Rheinheimera nanhaiensis]
MQELTFEQVEEVSGGFTGLAAPWEIIRHMDGGGGNGFIVGNIVGGVAGALGGAAAAIMAHSGGSNEGTPLTVILAGAAAGGIQGALNPATGVMSAARTAAGYVGAGVSGYIINQN